MSSEITNRTDNILGDFVSNAAMEYKYSPYPLERPGQTYIRTGRLGRSWESGRIAKNRHYIDNTANHRGRFYAMYVHGDSSGKRQARIHASNNWWVLRKDLNSKIPKLASDLEKAIKDLAK